ncbi:MAG: protein kinase [Deltaproteobacteria bacterium]|nr:protein kinase [Deltaproteobacteria bacterium]
MDDRDDSRLAEHLRGAAPDDSIERRVVLARVRAELVAAVSTPQRIGRFEILRRLGAGAMGTVYAARDVELERRVAIKLLHDASDAEARLRKEAKALARLRHPHIVSVFEIGSFEGRTHVVMELVDGSDVGAWLRAAPRSWREVLAVFLQAGQGLAAAHAAGTVHRDFKPENVLVGEDGSVRVADFGLARHRTPTGFAALESRGPATTGSRDGAVGTPAYMAPEVIAGERAGPHSDQFSFCVALWEALFGERVGSTAATSVFALPPPATGRVPPRVRLVLRRGLALRPESRWRDMDALVDALARTLRRRWSPLAVACALPLGFALLSGSEPATPPPCDAQLLSAAWMDDEREALRDHYARAFDGDGARTSQFVVGRIDARVAALDQRRGVACRVLGRGGADPEVELAQRQLACLERAELQLAATVEQLQLMSREALLYAAPVLPDGGEIAVCDDRSLLEHELEVPEDRLHDQLDLLRRLWRAGAVAVTGDSAAARAELTALVEQARALGHAPTLASVLVEQGRLLHGDGDDVAALAALREAVIEADRGGADGVRAVALALMSSRLADAHDFEGARHALAQADALRLRLSTLPAWMAASGELRLGYVENAASGPAAALPHYQRALELARAGGEDAFFMRMDALSGLGAVEIELMRIDDARAHLGELLAVVGDRFGDEHPDYGRALQELASCDLRVGNLEDAEIGYRRALAIRMRSVPASALAVAPLRMNLAIAMAARGRNREALDEFRGVLKVLEGARGSDDGEVARVLVNMAFTHHDLGEDEQGLAAATRALAIRERRLGAEHPATGAAHQAVALTASALGHVQEAESHFRRAIEIAERVEGTPARFEPLLGLGELLLAQGRDVELVALVGDDAACTRSGAAVSTCAGLEFLRARMLPRAERLRAIAQAEAARARLGAEQDGPLGRRIAAWLQAQGATPGGRG